MDHRAEGVHPADLLDYASYPSYQSKHAWQPKPVQNPTQDNFQVPKAYQRKSHESDKYQQFLRAKVGADGKSSRAEGAYDSMRLSLMLSRFGHPAGPLPAPSNSVRQNKMTKGYGLRKNPLAQTTKPRPSVRRTRKSLKMRQQTEERADEIVEIGEADEEDANEPEAWGSPAEVTRSAHLAAEAVRSTEYRITP